jgi:hypothetical protein
MPIPLEDPWALVKAPFGNPQPRIWLPADAVSSNIENGFPTYRHPIKCGSPAVDRWTPPLKKMPTSVADAPLDPFFRTDYLLPEARARNMSPDAFVLFLARKYYLQVYPWKPQPLGEADFWTFMVEEAKRPELKRRTFSLFLFLLVDMEVEGWWHTGAKAVPAPAVVASVLAAGAAEDFAL